MHQCFQSSLIPRVGVGRQFLFLKEEIEALCGAVEKLAPFVVYQSRCWTRARGPNADPLLPSPTICGKCAPLSEICRKVVTLECFIERTTPGHLRAAYRLAEHAQPSQFKARAASDPWACGQRVRPSVVSGGCSNCRKNRRRGARTSSWM